MAAEPAYTGPRAVPSSGAMLAWLGHSTALVEIDGVRLLTDPVLRRRIGHLVRIAPAIGATKLGAIDCVLLSHLHADHADLPTLRALARAGPVVAPASARPWLIRHGVSSVIGTVVGGEVAVGTVAVRAVPARHPGRRWPVGPQRPALGFVIRGSRSVYFAGDTDLFSAMDELRGSVDVALLPVGGWGPSAGEGHLDPERAAKAAALIKPAVAVPIHWGTYALPRPIRTSSDPAAPAREFADLTHRMAPGVEVRILAPGGVTRL